MRQTAAESIRILHIFGCMDRGGAETRTVELMRSLDRAKFRFEFVSLLGSRGEFDDEITAMGGEVHYLKLDWTLPFRFMALLVRHRYDVLHSHVHFFSAILLLLGLIGGVSKRIAHFRSTADGKGNGWPRRLRNRFLKFLMLQTATDIVGVSEASLAIALGSDWTKDQRCQVIYSGINKEDFQTEPDRAGVRQEFGFPSNCLLVIHVGRQVPEKNHVRLIHVFAEIARQFPEARLLLAGKRENRIEPEIVETARTNGILDRIVFAGVRNDIGRLLAAADLMIFPSLREGLPGAVVEASAAGIPIIASAIPGITELCSMLPGLVCLELEQPDSKWANCGIEAVERLVGNEVGRRAFPSLLDLQYSKSRFENLYQQAKVDNLTRREELSRLSGKSR